MPETIDGVTYYTTKEVAALCKPLRTDQTVMRYAKKLNIKPSKQNASRKNYFAEDHKEKILKYANTMA